MAELTTKQRRAIAALLTERTIGQAARVADVGERTLHTWLSDSDFRAALVIEEGEAIDAATRRLIALQDAAVDVFADILDNPKIKATTRLRAAQGVLDYLLKLRELRNLEQRLAELERKANES